MEELYGDEELSDFSPTPTQAEIKHAFKMKKRLMVYILDEVLCHYEMWRKYQKKGLEINDKEILNGYDDFCGTMELIKWVKSLGGDDRPALWILPYSDVQTIIYDLRKRFAMDLQIMWSHFEASAEKQAMLLAIAMMDLNLPDNFVDRIVNDLKSKLGKKLLKTMDECRELWMRLQNVREKILKKSQCSQNKYLRMLASVNTQYAQLVELEKALKEQFLLQKIIPALIEEHGANDYYKKPPASVVDLWRNALVKTRNNLQHANIREENGQ